MNILALDCAVSKFSIGVETEKGKVSSTFDIGMRQSEMIVPALQNTLSLAGIIAGRALFLPVLFFVHCARPRSRGRVVSERKA